MNDDASNIIPSWIYVGAYCATRNGKKIRIICTDRTFNDPDRQAYPVLGLDERGGIASFLPGGESVIGMSEHPSDLIGPWVEEIKWPWDLLPPWINWCAFDDGEAAYCYGDKPDMLRDHWAGNNMLEIPAAYAPSCIADGGDWKLSLTERPKK